MSVDIEFEMRGFDDIAKLLKTFEPKVKKRVLKGALRKGALVIKRAAKANAPVGTGALKRAIAHRTGRQPIAQVYVGSGRGKKDDGWYAHIIERGTKKHSLRKGASLKSGEKQDQTIIHPGSRKNNFMERSLNQSYRGALDAVATRMAELIEKEVYK